VKYLVEEVNEYGGVVLRAGYAFYWPRTGAVPHWVKVAGSSPPPPRDARGRLNPDGLVATRPGTAARGFAVAAAIESFAMSRNDSNFQNELERRISRLSGEIDEMMPAKDGGRMCSPHGVGVLLSALTTEWPRDLLRPYTPKFLRSLYVLDSGSYGEIEFFIRRDRNQSKAYGDYGSEIIVHRYYWVRIPELLIRY
jgi:hypothetical protein